MADRRGRAGGRQPAGPGPGPTAPAAAPLVAPGPSAPPVAGAGFDAFFRVELPRLVALATALTGDRQVAEDVAQEALFRAHQRWGRISGYDQPGAWCRRVTVNLASHRRARARSEAAAVARLAGRPPAVPLPPDDQEFWGVLRTLPKRQAAALALHYLDDLSVADVATVLGCAEGTAKAHLFKGRAALARRLGEDAP